MRDDDRFAYQVASEWSAARTIGGYAKAWLLVSAVLGLFVGGAYQSAVGFIATIVLLAPVGMIYGAAMVLMAWGELKRVRVLLARDADAWIVEEERPGGTKSRRGPLSELVRAEACVGKGHAPRVVLVDRAGHEHLVMEVASRFAYLDQLAITSSDGGDAVRRATPGWCAADLAHDMAARLNAFLHPQAVGDGVRRLRD